MMYSPYYAYDFLGGGDMGLKHEVFDLIVFCFVGKCDEYLLLGYELPLAVYVG